MERERMYARQHRGVVVAQSGVVAASQPLATAAGLQVLMRGGNFADAAIATSAVLCVVEPYNSQIGGDGFAIVYDAKEAGTTALNGSGAAPRQATREHFAAGIPVRGLAAATVPGLVSLWFALHERWGTLPVAQLLQPAIDYARQGFPAGYRYVRAFEMHAGWLQEFADTRATLTGGTALYPGAMIRQPDLGWTLEQIALGGREAFYRGPVMQRIMAFSRENGGLFTPEDWAEHRTQVCEPLRVTYRGYTVHGQPPVSQGHILLQQLNLIEGFDLVGMGPGSADTIHVQVEAKKQAFADRTAYLGDPDFVRVPVSALLSKEYAARRRRQIDLQRAAVNVQAGEVPHDTTCFCVADRWGNAVSFIQSVFWGFGCGVAAKGTGVLFNNRMTGFSLDPSSPNVLAPGKRPAHTLNACVVTQGTEERGVLAFLGGTPGGDVQVQSNLQVICNVIDFGMNAQEAVEAPRWQHGGAVGAPGELAGGVLGIETRVSERTLQELERRGHVVERLDPWGHGSAYQLIMRHPESGAYLAGSDPRCDGQAAGF